MAARYHLRLLGGFELQDAAGQDCTLPSRRACALLACLGLESPTSRAELAERLWPGLDHAAARRNLRRELARLREAGLQDVIEAGPDHLALGPEVASDAAAMRAALACADEAAALAAWGGPPLAGFTLAEAPAFEAWLQPQREAWVQRWREAAAARAERLEAAGALREALAWVERLRGDDPLQERHHAAAMRLHHRLGEPGAALQVFAQCEALLRAELGVPPSDATQALAERLRAAERLAPQFRPGAGAVPEGFELPLIGREAQAAALADPAVPVRLLLGEAGVGKTRLVQDTLRAATTLALPCTAEARHCALHPVGEALQAALASPLHAERLAGVDPAVRREAARLLPGLAPAGTSAAGDVRRERLLEALAELLDALATPAGTLWIDDLHEADEATLELLALLAHRRGQAPAAHVRVVAAARPQELEAHPQAADLVRRLQRAGLLQPLPLAPLAPAETLALVRAASGTGAGTLFAARLQRATQGNAFHLVETLRYLLGSGELRVQPDGRWHTRYDEATADYAELPVPPTLAATVVERVARLSTPARQLVEAAVFARRGFTLPQLRPATALDDWQAVDGLEEVLRLRLFTELPGGADTPAGWPRYRLVHELTRQALAPTVRPERRRLIHERLAGALIAQREAAEAIAAHLDEAGRPQEALPWHLAAAEDARRVAAWRGALAHLERAWAALAGGDPALRLRCLRERIDAARRAFELAAQGRAIDDLQAEGEARGDDALVVEALVLRAELGQLGKNPVPAIAPLQAALGAGRCAGDTTLQLRAVAALGTAQLAAGQVDAARRTLAGADPEQPGVPDAVRAALLTARANVARLQQQPATALPLLDRALALMAAPEQLEARLQTLNLRAHTQVMGGDLHAAVATLEAVLAEAEHARLMTVLRTVLPNLATLHTQLGELAQARRYLERGMRSLRSVDNPATHAALASRLAELELTAGHLGAALAAARDSIARYEANGGGSTDHAPWALCSLVFDHAGAGARSEALWAGLLQSPARGPGAGPEAVVRLRTLVARLPRADAATARAIADELQARREAPDAAYPTTEADLWRARALQRAGEPEAALALAATLPEVELGLLQHPASLWALRLDAARDAGRLDGALLAAAARAQAGAPALPALELAAALAAAHRAAGSPAEARHWAEWVRDAVAAQAASLADEPALAQGLRRRWRIADQAPSSAAGRASARKS